MRKFAITLLIPFLLGMLACNLPWSARDEVNDEVAILQQTLNAMETQAAEVTSQPEDTVEVPTEQPTEEPTLVPLPTNTVITPNFSFEGVSFLYGANIAANAWGEVIPEYIPVYEGIEHPEPEHINIQFNNYVDPLYYHEARILVYPVDRLVELDESNDWDVSTLQYLIASRPVAPVDFPFLPHWNAAAMIRTNIAYLDFQNGSGIRYLTQYGQALYPINNTSIFYTFQGITSDGRYYIAAILPVDHPNLLATGDEVGNDWAPFYDETAWNTYLTEETDMLNAQDPNSFTPSLEALDTMIRSLLVDR